MAADDLLFVVLDGAGGCLVALDEPPLAGPVSRTGRDGVIHLVPAGRAVLRHDPPGNTGLRLLTGAGTVAVAGATVALSALLTPFVGAPVGAAGLALCGAGYRNGRSALGRRWLERHRALRPAEAEVFAGAFSAAQTVLMLWPRLRDLVQVATPRRELAGSLWTLAGLLHDRAALGEQLASLDRAAARLPAGAAALRTELAQRRALVRASLEDLAAAVGARVAALETLAGECVDLVRDERAVLAALEAIARADRSLGRVAPAAVAAPDETGELAAQTRAIVAAYRELTGLTRRATTGGEPAATG
ncbi:hypothetical protein Daura_32665 [Dactylosporangium aurantiacum]|uniref:Uncharacterized protein n=1 Tax=Dactylosporangium aurantiacum TaxID=35754 RepID=A0A9Q9ICH3_9ACTN|nr:hypothetical protein [Dactylosporangium aurantiacum]MDG6107193.1 hypothetical protein [Dactylosporangium aurantiacum]UWZ51487.1 hypothetical protein Daura_32665 [Dactylosporangium aurantiacum]